MSMNSFSSTLRHKSSNENFSYSFRRTRHHACDENLWYSFPEWEERILTRELRVTLKDERNRVEFVVFPHSIGRWKLPRELTLCWRIDFVRFTFVVRRSSRFDISIRWTKENNLTNEGENSELLRFLKKTKKNFSIQRKRFFLFFTAKILRIQSQCKTFRSWHSEKLLHPENKEKTFRFSAKRNIPSRIASSIVIFSFSDSLTIVFIGRFCFL